MLTLKKMPSSLPGLTRQSIVFAKCLFVLMDARVEPAHDGGAA